MKKLPDAQQAMLLAAAARDDGAGSIPAKASRAGMAKVAASLIARKLMRESKAKAGAPDLADGWGRNDLFIDHHANGAASNRRT